MWFRLSGASLGRLGSEKHRDDAVKFSVSIVPTKVDLGSFEVPPDLKPSKFDVIEREKRQVCT